MRSLTMLLVAFLAGSLSSDPTISILRIGFHHQDEVSLDDKGTWHALVVSGSESYLKPVNVIVKRVPDPLDEDPNALNGRDVIADIKPDPILLVRGKVFQPDRVRAVCWEPLEIPFGKKIEIGTAAFSVQIQDSAIIEGQRQYTFALHFRIGRVDQVVATYSAYRDSGTDIIPSSEHNPSVIWAGDLDGDQRVDFLLDTSDHYNVDEVTLFLSSKRSTGGLVKAAARSRRVGC